MDSGRDGGGVNLPEGWKLVQDDGVGWSLLDATGTIIVQHPDNNPDVWRNAISATLANRADAHIAAFAGEDVDGPETTETRTRAPVELSDLARSHLYSYQESLKISAKGPDWYALLFALVRDADSDNMEKLEQEWPEAVAALRELYNAPLW